PTLPQANPKQSLLLLAGQRLTGASLDIVDDRRRVARIAMDHEPARTLRDPEAHDEDDQAESRANEEAQPPANLRIEQRRIQQYGGRRGAERRANPEAAVDGQVGPAAIARRYEFLDRRIDRGVFAHDAGPGQES